MRELYSKYRLKQNTLHELERFAHEVYQDLGCLFCFVDGGNEHNGSVLCSKCTQGPMPTRGETIARDIEEWVRSGDYYQNGLDYCAFMIAGDLFLELQDK